LSVNAQTLLADVAAAATTVSLLWPGNATCFQPTCQDGCAAAIAGALATPAITPPASSVAATFLLYTDQS
jgi:hypothetical protein